MTDKINHKYDRRTSKSVISFGRKTRDYVAKAEKLLNRRLKNKECVHHHTAEQLIICPDSAYHALLHSRTAALDACGDPSHRRCLYCKQYESIENLSTRANSKGRSVPCYFHLACLKEYDRKRWAAISARRAVI